MGSLRILLAVLSLSMVMQQCAVKADFAKDFDFYWGANRSKISGPKNLQLVLEKSGGSGIVSKDSYLYGSIEMKIKLVPGNSAGTVTTFYLQSNGSRHDEIDFEFLGNLTGQPYTIHTNIYTQGFGQREQQFKAWFDPTSSFHNYTIHWNPSQVVWFIDNIPIRVFRNFHDNQINYPDSQPMRSFASIWNGDQWATQGGRIKTNWTLAPFKASFQAYKAKACKWKGTVSITQCKANTKENWWSNPIYSKLNTLQVAQMKKIRKTSMIYNYCDDFNRFKGKFPKECSLPQF